MPTHRAYSQAFFSRVNVSMVSLKWGDALSAILPGAVVVFAVAPFSGTLTNWFVRIDQIGPGFALLIASALAGGLLEAWTRISWEKYCLVKWCKPPSVLHILRENQLNLDLYERGVQSSYKYATFYANFAWAIAVVLFSRLHRGVSGLCSIESAILAVSIAALFFASYVQWTYFVKYLDRVFLKREEKDAEKRPAEGNEGEVHKRDPEGEGK